ncbi:MAG: hypothetical protein NTX76_04630 [Alphaproteobacteria bacterium]|nr:hypothetical protein [Alphaproteobacteria bacterium]
MKLTNLIFVVTLMGIATQAIAADDDNGTYTYTPRTIKMFHQAFKESGCNEKLAAKSLGIENLDGPRSPDDAAFIAFSRFIYPLIDKECARTEMTKAEFWHTLEANKTSWTIKGLITKHIIDKETDHWFSIFLPRKSAVNYYFNPISSDYH